VAKSNSDDEGKPFFQNLSNMLQHY